MGAAKHFSPIAQDRQSPAERNKKLAGATLAFIEALKGCYRQEISVGCLTASLFKARQGNGPRFTIKDGNKTDLLEGTVGMNGMPLFSAGFSLSLEEKMALMGRLTEQAQQHQLNAPSPLKNSMKGPMA